jgi:hypothetical protein
MPMYKMPTAIFCDMPVIRSITPLYAEQAHMHPSG